MSRCEYWPDAPYYDPFCVFLVLLFVTLPVWHLTDVLRVTYGHCDRQSSHYLLGFPISQPLLLSVSSLLFSMLTILSPTILCRCKNIGFVNRTRYTTICTKVEAFALGTLPFLGLSDTLYYALCLLVGSLEPLVYMRLQLQAVCALSRCIVFEPYLGHRLGK